MGSQPQNSEIRNNPENLHPCICFESHPLNMHVQKFSQSGGLNCARRLLTYFLFYVCKQ